MKVLKILSFLLLLTAYLFFSCQSPTEGDAEETLISSVLQVYYSPVGSEDQLIDPGGTLVLDEIVVDSVIPVEIPLLIRNLSDNTIGLTGVNGYLFYSGEDAGLFSTLIFPDNPELPAAEDELFTIGYHPVIFNEGLKNVTVDLQNDSQYGSYQFSISLPTTAQSSIEVYFFDEDIEDYVRINHDSSPAYFQGKTSPPPLELEFEIRNDGFGRSTVNDITIEEWEEPVAVNDFDFQDLPLFPENVNDDPLPFIVLFEPPSTGTRKARIEIQTDADNNNPFIINLCGYASS